VQDLQARVLRHVTDSFREDPVRILRVARFAARFTDFTVAPETMQLMREMVEHGEVDHLVPERVWQELARGLMEAKPSRMFEVLRECGALQVLLPEVARLWGVPQPPRIPPRGGHRRAPDDGAGHGRAAEAPLTVRFACLAHDLGKGTTPADMLPRHIGHEERSAKLLRLWPSACACPWTAAKPPTWWRASTATSTAAATWAQQRWCACWSAATPSASPSALPMCCWPANAMRAGAWGLKKPPTRSASACPHLSAPTSRPPEPAPTGPQC
jgi:hypothetical protein